MEKKHHFKNMFKKDLDSESRSRSNSHPHLPKLFHREKHKQQESDVLDTESKYGSESKYTSPSSQSLVLLLKRNDTNVAIQSHGPPGRVPVRRSESLNHFGPRRGPLPSISKHPTGLGGHHEKIKYNPYGINKLMLNQATHLALFYLKGGPESGGRIVANPVADPNDYLPEELKEDHINVLDDFEFETNDKKLGDGGSGEVCIVYLNTNKKKLYALKKFSLFPKETDEEFYKRAAKEYILSRKVSELRHVVNTIALLRIQSQGAITRGWGMIMDFCCGGDLFNMIVKPGWKRTLMSERYCIFKQLAYGLKFLHDSDIVHRDLKPENVLMDSHGLAKLCDFGVSDYGHEEPGNFDSPVKLSTAYVGSPPYSPPEVMKLKEVTLSDLKNWAYDPFKMDHWGLGMLLFCLVYSGVPFQQLSPNDNHFRDYKFNRDRYISNFPIFKNNEDYTKGPGSEFKWASQFHSAGAARVAWKLCDPSLTLRYTLKDLFRDPWFTGLEMCVYEHEDQHVDPFVFSHSSNHSVSGSRQSSRAPSRKNTVSSFHHTEEHDHAELHTPVRSMLDMAGVGALPSMPGNDTPITPGNESDNVSLKSNSLLTHIPLHLAYEDKPVRLQRNNSEVSVSLTSSGSSLPRMRSMLDVAASPDRALPRVAEDETEKVHAHTPSSQLPVVNEVCNAGEQSGAGEESKNGVEQEPGSEALEVKEAGNEALEVEVANPVEGKEHVSQLPSPAPDNKNGHAKFLYEEPLHETDDLRIDSSGCCELGYKLKKHHHLDVSNVQISGSKSRR